MARAGWATLAALVACLAVAGPAVARRPHVVMLVLDEFPVDSLLRPDGSIDARRYPGFAALARHTTWYANATTVHDSTAHAVPAILEGRIPHGRELRRPRRTLFALLARQGWRLHSHEDYTRMCRLPGCESIQGRNYFENVRTGRPERLLRTIASIRRKVAPTFWFHHALLPHGPWAYLPSGRRYQEGLADRALGFASPAGFASPFLTLQNHQRHLLQVGFVDRLVQRLVRRLGRQRMWGRAIVVVMADHGVSFDLGTDDRRLLTPANVDEVAPVPLFVHLPGRRGGRVDRSLARTVDVLPTIARALRLRVRWKVSGRPLGSAAVRARRSLAFARRYFNGYVRISGRRLLQRRRVLRRRTASLFGSGSWSSVYRIGPNRELLDRRVSSLPVDEGGPVRARLTLGTEMTDLRADAPVWPSWVVGEIDGGAAGSERDLAVAVNGTVRAVARSFHLSDRPAEQLSAMVPEDALRPGRNVLELFEVSGGRLRRLARYG